MSLTQMKWPYYTLVDGFLFDEDGIALLNTPKFDSATEAQEYLEKEDLRGTVL